MIKKIVNIYRRTFWNGERYAKFLGVKIGSNCSIGKAHFGSEPYLIEIGNYVQITSVRFATHGGAWVLRRQDEKFDFFGKIKIGDNVYIGNQSIILPGVTIGQDVIVAAGSVVTKSVPSGKIIGGNPAKIIGDVMEFKERMMKFNVRTKDMNYNEKREFLLNTPDNKFVKKVDLKKV